MREFIHLAEFLETWLVLTGVKYHRNVLVSILVKQLLALLMFGATTPLGGERVYRPGHSCSMDA